MSRLNKICTLVLCLLVKTILVKKCSIDLDIEFMKEIDRALSICVGIKI